MREEVDNGYIGDSPHRINYSMSCTHPVDMKIIQGRARIQQETVNSRFKRWRALKQGFRNDIPKYAEAMYTVTVITQMQLKILNFFNVNYYDD